MESPGHGYSGDRNCMALHGGDDLVRLGLLDACVVGTLANQ